MIKEGCDDICAVQEGLFSIHIQTKASIQISDEILNTVACSMAYLILILHTFGTLILSLKS